MDQIFSEFNPILIICSLGETSNLFTITGHGMLFLLGNLYINQNRRIMKTKYGNVDFSHDSSHNDGLITGLLLGAAIGACAAILFAPKSGKDTREKIKDFAGKKADKLERQWENVKDKAGRAAGDAKDAFDSAADETGSKINDLADKAENEIEDGVETVADRFQKKY